MVGTKNSRNTGIFLGGGGA